MVKVVAFFTGKTIDLHAKPFLYVRCKVILSQGC